jgi:hypothetical protein
VLGFLFLALEGLVLVVLLPHVHGLLPEIRTNFRVRTFTGEFGKEEARPFLNVSDRIWSDLRVIKVSQRRVSVQ